MTTFSYTTGNPTNLTGGATASMNDIQGPFTDLRTYLNGGNIDYTNLASATDSYYKTVFETNLSSAGNATGTYVFATAIGMVSPNTVGSARSVRYINTADYPGGTRTPRLRIAVSLMVNTTAPAITYTYGLYPVTAISGVASQPTITLGAVVAGSTAAIASPSASSSNHVEGSEFTFPTTGYYALGCLLSGTETANSFLAHNVVLQFRAS